MLTCFTCGAGVISLSWQHFWYLKLGSGHRQAFIFEQQWWMHLLQWWQNIELLPIPFLHTPHGYLQWSTTHSTRGLRKTVLVFEMLTWSLFASKLLFPTVKWFSNASKDSSIITKSSSYSSSYGDPHQQSWDNVFITITNSRGLRTEPPHFDTKLFSKGVVYLETWCSISIHCLKKYNFSFLNTQLLHHPRDYFLGTLLKAFLRSAKAK